MLFKMGPSKTTCAAKQKKGKWSSCIIVITYKDKHVFKVNDLPSPKEGVVSKLLGILLSLMNSGITFKYSRENVIAGNCGQF